MELNLQFSTKLGDWESETHPSSKVDYKMSFMDPFLMILFSVANTTVEEPVKLGDEEKSRSKREVHEEDIDEDEGDVISDPEEKCRVDMWRCLSRVIEGGLHYIDHPEGIYRYDLGELFQ